MLAAGARFLSLSSSLSYRRRNLFFRPQANPSLPSLSGHLFRNMSSTSTFPTSLFVYGSLAPGEKNERYLKPLKGEWIEASVEGMKYVDGVGYISGYHTVLPHPSTHGSVVPGLVFMSEELNNIWNELDEFEGTGYIRTEIEATLKASGDKITTYIYSMDVPVLLNMGLPSPYTLHPVSSVNFDLYSKLLHAYETEFAPLTHKVPLEDGSFAVDAPLDDHTFAYILHKGDEPAGFAVVESKDGNREMMEFYVAPDHRKNGTGTILAHQMFKLYPGKWQVLQLVNASYANVFWKKTIERYGLAQDLIEDTYEDDHYGPTTRQRFTSPNIFKDA